MVTQLEYGKNPGKNSWVLSYFLSTIPFVYTFKFVWDWGLSQDTEFSVKNWKSPGQAGVSWSPYYYFLRNFSVFTAFFLNSFFSQISLPSCLHTSEYLFFFAF